MKTYVARLELFDKPDFIQTMLERVSVLLKGG